MKRYPLLAVVVVLCLVSHVEAGVVTLEWDAEPTWATDGATGVIIYASPTGAETWQRVAKVPYPATTVRLRLPDIVGGYDYKATAYIHSPWYESDYSNVVTATPDATKVDKAAVLVGP